MKRTRVPDAPAPSASAAGGKRFAALVVALGALAVVYVALLPWIRDVQRKTAEIERQTQTTLEQSGRVQNAQYQLYHLEEAVKRQPNDGQVRLELAAALKQAGRLPEALEHARAAARDKSLGDRGYAALADLQYLAKDHYGAMKSFEEALRIVPENMEAMRALGFLYISFGWTSDAVKLLKPASKRRPDEAGIRSALALAYVQENDYEKAEAELLAVRRLLPNDPGAWSPLADVYVKANRHEDARRVASDALNAMPDDPRLLLLRGRAHLGLGNFELARNDFTGALKADPENTEALYNTGVAYQKERRSKEALQAFERVHSVQPGYERTQLLLGTLYLQTGRAQDGQRLMEAFRQREPGGRRRARLGYLLSTQSSNPEAHYRMALAYQEDGNVPRAMTELRRTLDLKPGHSAAAQLLKKLSLSTPAPGP